MQSLYAIDHTAKQIKLLNALAAVLAYPAVFGFAWLWLIDGRQRGFWGSPLFGCWSRGSISAFTPSFSGGGTRLTIPQSRGLLRDQDDPLNAAKMLLR